MNSETALSKAAAGSSTSSETFKMLPLQTEDSGTDGQQCSELAASEEGISWPTREVDRSDRHVQHYLQTPAWAVQQKPRRTASARWDLGLRGIGGAEYTNS